MGLGAVLVVPALSGLVRFLEPLLETTIDRFPKLAPLLNPHIPAQMAMLFFSGLMFVIANVVFYFRCPSIIKRYFSEARTNHSEPYHREFIAQNAASFLSRYVDRAEFTKEWIEIFERQNPNSASKDDHFSEYELELCRSMLSAGYSPQVVGLSGKGIYYTEAILIGIAHENGGRLFVRGAQRSSRWEQRERPQFILFANEFRLYNGLMHSPLDQDGYVEDVTEKDIFLEWMLASPSNIIPSKRDKIKNFNSLICDFDYAFHNVEPLKAEKIVAPYAYFLRPISRIIVALSFVLALIFLAMFLFWQTKAVIEAVF